MTNAVAKRLASPVAALALALALGCSGCSSSATANSPGTNGVAGATRAVATGAPVPSSGCATAQPAAVANARQDIDVGGVARWFLLTTPAPGAPSPTHPAKATPTVAASTIPRPLVVDFHGLAEGATIHSATTQFGALGQRQGFVVAFPNGTGSPVRWDSTTQGSSNTDLQFVTAMLEQLESTLCIDTSRVYASGLSDGSFMVSLLACTMSDRFAAIAAVSGLQMPEPCPTTRRVPILTFHGTADPILLFNGGIGTATLNKALGRTGPAPSASTTTTTQPVDLHGSGYPATVRAWAAKDGCRPQSSDTKVASEIILRTYPCPKGTAVEFYIVIGGGHSWPGSRFSQSISSITGRTTFQINATRSIWAFFQRFQL
jgi:polyhydroxybutyrate depolymerase